MEIDMFMVDGPVPWHCRILNGSNEGERVEKTLQVFNEREETLKSYSFD